ncbi:MAG TPA: RDD family protein [Pyrinomonadaceae bacterium]|nr:RDD family protein [Pyrinomonadaceae bacterium]
MTDSPNETQKTTQAPHGSTLIEFPGVNRNRPAWRKELSEKVREIQQRRAREAAIETGEAPAPGRRAPAPPRSSEAANGRGPDAPAAAAGEESGEESAKQLGLVPPPETPELNPLVAAALRRIERARTRAPHASRPAHGRTQAAAARVLEEQFDHEEEQEPSAGQAVRPATAARPDRQEAAHVSNLVVVAPPRSEATPETEPAPQAAPHSARRPGPPAPAPRTVSAAVTVEATTTSVKDAVKETTRPAITDAAPAASRHARTSTPAPPAPTAATATAMSGAATVEAPATSTAGAETRPQPRKIAGVIDDHWLERNGNDPLPKVEAAAYDDRAAVGSRVGAAFFDLLAVAFLCAPFAAVIELTIGEWHDPRVLGSMGGIVAVVMFLYHTCAVALAGRTWGMHFLSLHVVDADSARVPTTWQCAVRALVYMLSLATFGLGILYALIDAEGRTAHDLLSRTVMVRE